MSGCFFSKKPKAVQVPNPPAPAQASAPPAASAPAPATTQKKASRSPRKKAEPPAQAAVPATPVAPATPATAAPTASPGQLGQILSPEEKAQLTRSLDQSVTSARALVARSSGRTLSVDQLETVKMIRALVAQAEAARASDLSVAAQLARRAELLARDLAASLR
jgi:hypothetical protein